MSTDFYRTRSPITSIEIERHGPAHAGIRVFVNHVLSGTLIVRSDEVSAMVQCVRDDEAIVHRWWGGPADGTQVSVAITAGQLTDDTFLISEAGDEMLTLAKLRRQIGRGKDGGGVEG